MREQLRLPPGLHLHVWRHEPRGHMHHWHHHDEPEFNLVVRGTARYLLDDRRYDIGPGCLVWLFPAQEHLLVDLSDDFVSYIGVIRPALLRRSCPPACRPLLARDPAGTFSRRVASADLAFLAALCADFSAASATDHARANAGAAWLFFTLWQHFANAADEVAGSQVHPAVERAASHLASDPEADIASVARSAGLSRSRLSRLFHQQVGTTLVAYRARRRVDRFLALRRRHPQRSLLALALAAGFGSYAQFHRAFRAATGVNPARWRDDQPLTEKAGD